MSSKALVLITLISVILGLSVANQVENDLTLAADDLAAHFKRLSQDELTLPNKITPPPNRGQNRQTFIQRLQRGIEKRVQKFSHGVMDNVEALDQIITEKENVMQRATIPSCCNLANDRLSFDPQFGTGVDLSTGCHIASESWSLASHVANVFQRNTNLAGHWQYFLSVTGGQHVEYPSARVSSTGEGCGMKGDIRHRNVFNAVLHSQPQYVIILFDRGQDMTSRHLDLGRSIVQYIISTLSEQDHIGFVAFAEDAFFPLSKDCAIHTMSKTNLETKIELSKFINVVQPSRSGKSDLSVAFRAAQKLMINTEIGGDVTVKWMLISNGDLDEMESANVFNTLANIRQEVRQQIVINFYDLITSQEEDSQNRISRLISEQSYQDFNITRKDKKPIIKGQFVKIKASQNLGRVIGDYLGQPRVVNDGNIVSVSPHFDPVSKSIMISFAGPVIDENGNAVGITGTDVPVEDFLNDFLSNSKTDISSFACLLEREGSKLKVLFHPKLMSSGPTFSRFASGIARLDQIERIKNLDDLENRILSMPSGTHQGFRWSEAAKDFTEERIFSWQWVGNTKFIIFAIHTVDENMDEMNKFSYPRFYNPLLYYQLDQLSMTDRQQLCSTSQNGVSSLESGSLYISPAAFSSSYRHKSQEDKDRMMQNYMAFLTDSTNIIANPGLREGIKNEVSWLSSVVALWKNTSVNGFPTSVERSVAMITSDLLVTFPAREVTSSLNADIAGKKWVSYAAKYPNYLTMSGPVLHPSGVGYVFTLSKAITSTTIFSADLPLNYLDVLIENSLPACKSNSTRCFIIDHEGFLIYHPIMTNPSNVDPIEGQHLNHKEPQIGSDLMSNKSSLVEKRLCKSFADQMLRRYYDFNTKYSGVFKGQINNCIEYYITPLQGTNAFLGFVNVKCSTPTVFCPCNQHSRRCFFCVASEEEALDACECPCECGLKRKSGCFGDVGHHGNSKKIPSCDSNSFTDTFWPTTKNVNHDNLPKCYTPNCSSKSNRDKCLLTTGCSWCQVEVMVNPEFSATSFIPIKKPYCAEQNQCFGGAVGGANPYEIREGRGKMLRERVIAGKRSSSSYEDENRSSPIVAIIGGIVGFFLFMSLSVFCYRQRYVEESGQSCVRMNALIGRDQNRRGASSNIEVEDEEELKEMQGHHNLIAIEPTNSNIMSPYRMNPTYRRPPQNGADSSDHGYSTMTPMNDLDSEVILPYLGSAPSRDRIFRRPHHPSSVTSGSVLMSSRASSPSLIKPCLRTARSEESDETSLLSEHHQSNNQTPLDNKLLVQQTNLLHPNQIIVAATVHQVEEAVDVN